MLLCLQCADMLRWGVKDCVKQPWRRPRAQDRFEEKWAQIMPLKLAEVEASMKIEEEAARQRLAEAAQRAAAEAAAAAAARLAGPFEAVEARLQDAKALAVTCCEPQLTQAEKARRPDPNPRVHVRPWRRARQSTCGHLLQAAPEPGQEVWLFDHDTERLGMCSLECML